MLINIIYETWNVILSAGPYLLFGFLAAGVIYALVSTAWIASQLGQRNWKSVLLASSVGIPLPLCSCSVIPTAATIRQKGASRGATSSFLISTPEIGVASIFLTYAMMDWVMTLMRPIIGFFTALFAGLFINRWGEKEEETQNSGAHSNAHESSCSAHEVPQEQASCCSNPQNIMQEDSSTSQSQPIQVSEGCSTPNIKEENESCCSNGSGELVNPTSTGSHSQQKDSYLSRFKQTWIYRALHFSFVDLAGDLSHWLLLGFVISGLIGALLPTGIFEGWLGQGFTSLVLMLLIAMPMYICASASTPVAAMLIAKGLSPGAALVFLLAGPATNIGNLPIVAKLIGKRSTAIYLASIIAGALLAGTFVNYLYHWIEVTPHMHVGEHAMGEDSPLHILSAIFLVFLMLKGIITRPLPKEWHDVLQTLKKPLRSTS